MIKIPNFYASSPLRNERPKEIGEKEKDSLRNVYTDMDKAIKEHNKLNRSESIAGNPFSDKSSERFKKLEGMKFKFKDKEYNATNLIRD